MKITKDKLKQIIKEELDNMVDESLPSRLIGKTHKEKMADRAKKEKFYDRPRVEYTDDEKATRAKGYDAGSLATMVMMLQSDFKVAAPQEAYNEMINLPLYKSLTDEQKAGLSIKGD